MSEAPLPPSEELAKGSKLFLHLDESGRKRLLAAAQARRFAAGEVVVREGDPGDSFFVILRGKVRVSVDDLGTEKQLNVLSDGAFFGEMSVVSGEPRTATVTAESDLAVLEFGRARVEELLREYPKVREVMGRVGAMRSEDALEKMMKGDS